MCVNLCVELWRNIIGICVSSLHFISRISGGFCWIFNISISTKNGFKTTIEISIKDVAKRLKINDSNITKHKKEV